MPPGSVYLNSHPYFAGHGVQIVCKADLYIIIPAEHDWFSSQYAWSKLGFVMTRMEGICLQKAVLLNLLLVFYFAPLPFALGQNNSRELCGQAYGFIVANKYSEAMATLEAAIKADPKLPDAYLLRGRIRFDHLKQFEQAKSDFSKALELDPQYYDAYKAKALLELSLKQYSEAAADMTKAVAINAKDHHDYGLRGVMYQKLRLHEKALQDFDLALQADPSDWKLRSLRATSLTGLKRYSEAIAEYTRVLPFDKTLNTLGFRSLTYYRAGKYSEALADATAMLKKEPNNWAAYQTLGHVASAKKDHKQALQYYDKSLKLKPKEGNTLVSRGLTYAELGQLSNALADFSEALSLESDDPVSARLARANIYNRLGNHKAAIEDANKAIKSSPKNDNAYSVRGSAYIDLKKYEEALADLNNAVRLNPKDAENLRLRGEVWFLLDKYDEAAADYSQSLNLVKSANTIFLRANCYRWQEKYKEALADYNAALLLAPANKNYLLNRGTCLSSLEKYEDAVVDFDKLLKLDPNNHEALFGYAVAILLWKDDYNQALDKLNCALKLKPDDPDYLLWRSRVYLQFGEYEKSLLDSTKVLDIGFDSGEHKKSKVSQAKLFAARALCRTGHPDKAQEILQALVLADFKKNPQDFELALELDRESKHFMKAETRANTCKLIAEPDLHDPDKSEYDNDFANKFSSSHFFFESNECRLRLIYYGNFAEAYCDALAVYFGPGKEKPKRTRFLAVKNQGELLSYAKRLKLVSDSEKDAVGIYDKVNDIIIVDCSKSFYPAAFCLSEKLLREIVESPEPWAAEGIPSFFGRVYGYFDDKEPCKLHPFFLPWRSDSPEFKNIKLSDVIEMKQGAVDSGKAHLLAAFLYERDKLKSYLSLAKEAQKNGYGSYVEAAFGRNLDLLSSDWTSFLEKVENDWKKTETRSFVEICDNAEEFAIYKKLYPLPFAGPIEGSKNTPDAERRELQSGSMNP